jgi:hypothetical protein
MPISARQLSHGHAHGHAHINVGYGSPKRPGSLKNLTLPTLADARHSLQQRRDNEASPALVQELLSPAVAEQPTSLDLAEPVPKPPPWYRDWYFWGAVVNLVGSLGYASANYIRAFTDGSVTSNILWLVLAWLFVFSAAAFHAMWFQSLKADDEVPPCCPHLFAEHLNIGASFCYGCTSICYFFEVPLQLRCISVLFMCFFLPMTVLCCVSFADAG